LFSLAKYLGSLQPVGKVCPVKFFQGELPMDLPFRRMTIGDVDEARATLSLPSVKSHWDGGISPSRNVERIQSKTLFAFAADAIGCSNPTIVERAVTGPSYSSLERKRLFERLTKGEYRLAAGLARKEPHLRNLLGKLQKRAGHINVERILNWPLWELLDADFNRWEIESVSDQIEVFCYYDEPAPPRPDVYDIERYFHRLFPFDYEGQGCGPEHDCQMLHMAILCLHRALATSNLAQYIITYESLFNKYLNPATFGDDFLIEVVWTETLSHVNRWFRTLELHVDWLETPEELFDRCLNLRGYGIDLRAFCTGRDKLRAIVEYPSLFKEGLGLVYLPDSIEAIKRCI
jgi:hypothetical protein